MRAASAAALLCLAAGCLTELPGDTPGGRSFSTRIYAAPFTVADGSAVQPDELLRRLERLRYRGTPAPAAPGEYSWDGKNLSLYLRGFSGPAGTRAAGQAELRYDGERWETGGADAVLEPELAAEFSAAGRSMGEPAAYAEIPAFLRLAVIAAEDKRFFSHRGLDLYAMGAALWRDLTRRGLWGGSTITQQLAKNLYLSPRRTLARKLKEAALALRLERRYGKEEILTLYLNRIYLGQDGPFCVTGVKAAADFYFARKLPELTLAESALLAGLIRSPYRYDPRRNPAAALARRNYVLGHMLRQGLISREQRDAAAAEPLRTAPRAVRSDDNAYFTAEALRLLLRGYDEDEVFRYGLTVYTTLDTELQAAAAAAARAAPLEAALAVIDPADGRVLALAGGRDYSVSQFNRATQALRQPGSAFKPFVYGAALEAGFTAATLLDDTTRAYRNPDGSVWTPRNYDGISHGTVTLRAALERSFNLATVDLAGRTGPAAVAAFAARLGIKGAVGKDLAAALGTSEVTPLELTAAYAPFANGGLRVEPYLLAAVTGPDGKTAYLRPPAQERVISPQLAFLMTSLLAGVTADGTAAGALRAAGWERPAAGKTGTSSGGRDAWFIGYVPGLLAGVWTGDDSGRAAGVSGAGAAVPVWAGFMKAALKGRPPEDFAPPGEGLEKAVIDPASGLLAVAGCPQRREELFLAGTAPKGKCPLHSRGLKGWFKRLLGLH